MQFGTDTYRRGALERLEDARVLLDHRKFVLAIYAAGLAVEGMLRSLVWLGNREFCGRHDLRELATRVRDLGLLRPGERDEGFVSEVQGISRCWLNSLRYADADKAAQWLYESDVIDRSKVESLNKLSREHYERCSRVIKRCEVVWTRNRKSK
jgi:HEPN domain-containing protein